jgi:tetratricopeptide (TPR) repeat protein
MGINEPCLGARKTVRSSDLKRAVRQFTDVASLAPAFAPSLFEYIYKIWRRAIDRIGIFRGQRTFGELGAEALYLRARLQARAGDLKRAERQFAEVASLAPTFTPALEAHGEALDMLGQSERARSKYDNARKLRSQVRNGAPDRCVALRNRGPFTSDIIAYTAMLRMGHSKRRALIYIARGNAYLATGYPKLALLDYGFALRVNPKLHEVIAIKGEALAMLGRYRQAMSAFDTALAGQPQNAEIYGGRAIVQLALGRVDAADADWRRQLELLPPERASARACVLLRLADYEAALPELQRAFEKEPADPYWQLYRLMSLQRLCRTAGRPGFDGAAADAWPGPLLALHAGQLSADDALKRADNEDRRAEALFQIGIVACPRDRAEARRRWQQVVDKAPPAMIEHAAARHELARLGC